MYTLEEIQDQEDELHGIDAEHFKPIPRNRTFAESLGLINEGNLKEAARVIGFASELREKNL